MAEYKTKRIAKNTGLLYIRMVMVMAINLYTVRVVLNALGAEDYGIFNVVAGIVTMMSCVTYVLSSSTQRFYSYALGEHSVSKLIKVFSASINIYIIFSIIVFIFSESIGIWFVNTHLSIPIDKIQAANYIFQFSILSFILSVIQCPYSAMVISHEDMGIFSCINLFECILKFIVALLLSYIPYNKLISYGALLVLVPFISFISYLLITRYKYEECRYSNKIDFSLYKEYLSFSGWNLFASLAGVGMNQVINILINIFFGPLASASRAISVQINNAMNSFSSSYIMALRPQMIKSYAEKDYKYLNKLFSISNKLIYYSMLIIVIPLYIEMDEVLYVWLEYNDTMTIVFSKLTLIYILIMILNNPISIVMQASGKVKEYFLPVESMTIMCPIICWFLFRLGYPAESAFYAMIIITIASHIIRLICLKKYYGKISIKSYILEFLLPAVVITFIAYLMVGTLHSLINDFFIRISAMVITCFFLIIVLVFLLGLSKDERYDMLKLISKIK